MFCSQLLPSNGSVVNDAIVAGSRQLTLTLIPSGWDRGT
jgi:hypothetical protein